jgi:putative transposase
VRRELANRLVGWYEISGRRACGLVLLSRGTYHYRSHAQDHSALKIRLKDLAMSRVRFGYRRLLVLLKREGWPVGKKLVYRLYAQLGLQVRTKRRKKLAGAKRYRDSE